MILHSRCLHWSKGRFWAAGLQAGNKSALGLGVLCCSRIPSPAEHLPRPSNPCPRSERTVTLIPKSDGSRGEFCLGTYWKVPPLPFWAWHVLKAGAGEPRASCGFCFLEDTKEGSPPAYGHESPAVTGKQSQPWHCWNARGDCGLATSPP